jgi:hypothetical protein
MSVRKISFVLWTILMVACARTKDSQTQTMESTISHLEFRDTTRVGINQLYSLESYLHDQPLDTALVNEINFDCAVLVYPGDEQIQQMKREYGEEDFYIIADDNNWYHTTSIRLLDSAKVQTITPRKQFVRFVGDEMAWTLNLRRKGSLSWNLIFFNHTKKPEVVSTVDLTMEEIKAYFEK